MKKTNINNLFSIRPLKPKIFIQDKNHVIIQEKKIPINSTKPIVISAPSLPGIPNTAIILETAIGEGFIEFFKSKYSL